MYLDVILLTFENTNSIGILLKTIKEKLKHNRGGSRGRVQGVRTPPPPEIKFRIYVFTFKNFLAHCQ